jgi:hypothetical protein
MHKGIAVFIMSVISFCVYAGGIDYNDINNEARQVTSKLIGEDGLIVIDAVVPACSGDEDSILEPPKGYIWE